MERNPVRAGIVETAWEYPWSKALAHLAGRDDLLVKGSPLLKMVGDWKGFLLAGDPEEEIREIRRQERTGRPLGKDSFVIGLEKTLARHFGIRKQAQRQREEIIQDAVLRIPEP